MKANIVKDEKFMFPLAARKLALSSPTSNSLKEISLFSWLWIVKVRTECYSLLPSFESQVTLIIQI